MPKLAPVQLVEDVIDAIAWIADNPPKRLRLSDRLKEDVLLTVYQIKALAPPLERVARRYDGAGRIGRGQLSKATTVKEVAELTAKAAGFTGLPDVEGDEPGDKGIAPVVLSSLRFERRES